MQSALGSETFATAGRTTNRPEEVSVLGIAGSQDTAVGDDDRRLNKVVDRQSVFGREPSEAASQSETSDA